MNNDFSYFSEVGFVETPPKVEGTPFSVELQNPISARYIAIYETRGVLQIGHIQVYTYIHIQV